ncbi:MAG: hypothetical protein ACOX3X_02260 [Eubacteriales bacterium]
MISLFNVDSFPSIATELMRLEPDSYITEIAEERVELDTIGANITPSLIAYKSAIDFLIHRIKNGSYKGNEQDHHGFQDRVLQHGEKDHAGSTPDNPLLFRHSFGADISGW